MSYLCSPMLIDLWSGISGEPVFLGVGAEANVLSTPGSFLSHSSAFCIPCVYISSSVELEK